MKQSKKINLTYSKFKDKVRDKNKIRMKKLVRSKQYSKIDDKKSVEILKNS